MNIHFISRRVPDPSFEVGNQEECGSCISLAAHLHRHHRSLSASLLRWTII